MNASHPASSLSRRHFLQQAGAAASIGAVASWSAAYAEAADAPKVRIGIVGGRFGCGFEFHEHPGCIVEAVSDLRPERRDALSKVYACQKTYESLEKLILDPKIDAVFIATEATNHVPHALLALNAGKHVLSAVPAAMTLEECQTLIDAVERSGLAYMMAETSYWQQSTISARKFFEAGDFGDLYQVYSAYRHAGLEVLWVEDGKPTWRHGFPPMLYPTHCTSHLIGVTGDRLTSVSCHGWGDQSAAIANNPYDNPFWNESAQFKTRDGRNFNVEVWWAGAHAGGERAEWYGDKMSFISANGYGTGPVIVRNGEQTELDSGGFVRAAPRIEQYQQPHWWDSDLLPPPLRHDSGHEGSHCFITHEFIDSIQKNRRPAIDVYESVAYTAPGIVAHESALKGGEQMTIPSFDKA